jgi:hypothetical protein
MKLEITGYKLRRSIFLFENIGQCILLDPCILLREIIFEGNK